MINETISIDNTSTAPPISQTSHQYIYVTQLFKDPQLLYTQVHGGLILLITPENMTFVIFAVN